MLNQNVHSYALTEFCYTRRENMANCFVECLIAWIYLGALQYSTKYEGIFSRRVEQAILLFVFFYQM